jgi:hypothetical protein
MTETRRQFLERELVMYRAEPVTDDDRAQIERLERELDALKIISPA